MDNINLESTYDKVENTNSSKQTWEVAIGLNKVDNLEPSKYLLELSEKSYNSNMTPDNIEEALRRYYSVLNTEDEIIASERECDLVATRIVKLLNDKSFKFSPIYLKSIHKALFDGIFEYPLNQYIGKFRDYNITKKEPVLKNESVTYGDYGGLLEYLKYDFDEEEEINYTKFTLEKQIKRIAKFTSAIWQVHPFCEGNTRTVAIFMIKYLNFLGFEANNDLFKEHSKYFRDALVLSNYTNVKDGYRANFKYLESFYSKLLNNKDFELEKIWK
ncbi:MAG: Fic family protein [Sarcina sp.]